MRSVPRAGLAGAPSRIPAQVAGGPGGTERRTHPRLPAELPVFVETVAGTSPGSTLNASEYGLLVRLRSRAPLAAHRASIALELPCAGWCILAGHIVRHEATESSGALAAFSLMRDEWAPPPTTALDAERSLKTIAASGARRRRSRARPRPARRREEALLELRGLGGLVYEQALLASSRRPVRSLLDWADQLAEELGVAGVGAALTNRELLHGLAAVSGRCGVSGRTPVSARPEAG
jgi:hypothetical protein